MKSGEGFSHWVDGRKTWELGFAGFFTRLRAYIASSILVGLPLAGTPFWWPEKLPDKIELSPVAIILGFSTAAFLIFTFLFFYTRSRTDRSLEIKSKLHQLAAEANESLLALYRRSSRSTTDAGLTALHEAEHLIEVSKRLAEIIGQYFMTLTGDRTVGAIICIASVGRRDGAVDTAFATLGRSSTLNKDRGATSEALPRDKGFAKFFLESAAGCKGVLFIEDIEKAMARGVYHATPNDKIYRDDFKTLAVVPILGWNGSKSDLIGLLALTSRTSRLLQPRHVDLMKFTGEALGLLYSSTYARLMAHGAMPENIGGTSK